MSFLPGNLEGGISFQTFNISCLQKQQCLATFGTVMETRLQRVGLPPCPLFALLQGGALHICPPGQYGWVTAMEVGGHRSIPSVIMSSFSKMD